MNSRKWLWLLLGLAVGAPLSVQWFVLERAAKQADWLIGRARPWLDARYMSLWAWPGHAGWANSVHARPGPRTLRVWPGLRGAELRAARVQVHEYRERGDGTPERLSFSVHGLSLRLPPHDTAHEALPAPVFGIYPMHLRRLGYDSLRGELHATLQLLPEIDALSVELSLQIDELADLDLRFELDTDARILRELPPDLGLRFGTLRLRDAGLIARYREQVAAQKRLSLPAAEADLIGRFDDWLRQVDFRWDAETANALRRFLRGGATLIVEVAPMDDVALRDYPLYALSDWPVLLGLKARIEDAGP